MLRARLIFEWASTREVEIVTELHDGALALVAGEGEVFLLPNEYEIIAPNCIICFRSCRREGILERWTCPKCLVKYDAGNLFYMHRSDSVDRYAR